MPIPEKRTGATSSADQWHVHALVFGFALIAQLLAYGPGVNLYDEGIILVGADSIRAGKLPYRDFWTMYGPGQFYLTAWLFNVFGAVPIVARAIGIVSKSAIVLAIYAGVRRTSGGLLALAGATLTLGILIGAKDDAFPIFPALALALLAMSLLEQGMAGRRCFLIAAGVTTGLAACFRHDLGVACVLAAATTTLVQFATASPPGQVRRALLSAGGAIGYYVAGVATVVLPVSAVLLVSIPAPDLWENLVRIPFFVYPRVRSLPWPGVDALRSSIQNLDNVGLFSVYVPFGASALAAAVWARRPGAHSARGVEPTRAVDDGSFLVLLTGATSVLFAAKGLVRVSPLHMAPAIVLSVLLLAWSISQVSQKGGVQKTAVMGGSLFLVAILGVASAPGIRDVGTGLQDLGSGKSVLASACSDPVLPRLTCGRADPDYVRAALFVKETTREGDRIYVGVGRHDKIFVNAVAFYFLVERRPVTKWYELHPGVQTESRIQRQIVAEMQGNPPRLLILDDRWDDVEEPNLSSVPSGVTLLDDYIARRYKEIRRFGTVRVLAER
ncbi:MAG: hypothetical protein AB1806_18365 [Acidobacteriota bacterium]